jgi:hypothetical protein
MTGVALINYYNFFVITIIFRHLSDNADAADNLRMLLNLPTNPHWARVVGYGPFSLWVIHKEDAPVVGTLIG